MLSRFRVVGRPKTDYTNMTARTENLTDFNRYDIINKLFSQFEPYLIKAIKIAQNNLQNKEVRKTLLETGLAYSR